MADRSESPVPCCSPTLTSEQLLPRVLSMEHTQLLPCLSKAAVVPHCIGYGVGVTECVSGSCQCLLGLIKPVSVSCIANSGHFPLFLNFWMHLGARCLPFASLSVKVKFKLKNH